MKKIDISQIATLPTRHGTFKIQAFREGDKEHLALFTDPLPSIPLVRVHSECLTGDALGSLKCDCGEQLQAALKQIAEEGGMLIYHRQEGRNIGLLNKVNAYALQDQGLDTVAANHQLGFAADERTYEIVETILEHFRIRQMRLLTNNPRKIESLKGVEILERVPLIIEPNPYNEKYLRTKKEQMGHLL
ncbi:GTP cyclohydrolase II [Nitratifractor salsuginis]|uniref:GTP cyclohydrolase-2 n=1 Tax=Nitratifractor salsuginis (strain DSM 16511 / JCM 12458 / E9I37-1) TaxID=749222 RepID=E6X2F8_NITSE|nr:GTP cyclohydrolase II [Nitratifractor salsuginis]ADV47163.1 GTP cyclohydrolase II [Nitratifractor salsuginis DSM 16511]